MLITPLSIPPWGLINYACCILLYGAVSMLIKKKRNLNIKLSEYKSFCHFKFKKWSNKYYSRKIHQVAAFSYFGTILCTFGLHNLILFSVFNSFILASAIFSGSCALPSLRWHLGCSRSFEHFLKGLLIISFCSTAHRLPQITCCLQCLMYYLALYLKNKTKQHLKAFLVVWNIRDWRTWSCSWMVQMQSSGTTNKHWCDNKSELLSFWSTPPQVTSWLAHTLTSRNRLYFWNKIWAGRSNILSGCVSLFHNELG